MSGDVTAGLVICPGDCVIVGLVADVDEEQALHVRNALRARLPGVDFVIVSGLTTLAAYREGDR